MKPTNKLTLNYRQKEWLSLLIMSITYNLIPEPPIQEKNVIVETFYESWYEKKERDILNHYLKKYPLPLLEKLLRERK